MEYIEIFVDAVLHRRAKHNWNRIMNIVSLVQNLIDKQ